MNRNGYIISHDESYALNQREGELSWRPPRSGTWHPWLMSTFVFRLKAPRPTFALDMSDEEREIMAVMPIIGGPGSSRARW